LGKRGRDRQSSHGPQPSCPGAAGRADGPGLAAALDAVLIHPKGEAGHCFRYDPDADVDRGELDRGPLSDGLAEATDAEVEGGGRADGVRGLIAGAE